VLLFLVGWGLYRWRWSARLWAVWLSRLFLALLAIWFPFAVYAMFGGKLPDNISASGADARGLLVGAVSIAYLIWQLRVLGRPDIVRRFETLPSRQQVSRSNKQQRWRFSLEMLFLATIVAGFAILQTQEDDFWWHDTYGTRASTSRDGRENRRADYTLAKNRFFDRPEKLRFALLTRGDATGHSSVTFSDDTPCAARVILQNGKTITVPKTYQLYEIADGELRHRDERVPAAVFNEYVASQPDEWSIDALIRFAEKQDR
jgi:hypothetical protein